MQTPHDFFNHDSVQHYVVGRHEQSLFYRVVCPGKDRHGAAYWCGSAALIHREALLEIGGVATETIAEDFHTTIRLQRHGWKSRYHDEVLVQGLAPHDLDGYLLQRDRWARGNLAVFTLPESPLRARELRPLQRLSYFASLAAYLAPPMRLLLLLDPGRWCSGPGALPMKISVLALAALWLPSVALNLSAGTALARGYMRIPETAHYELLTMEIYTRALRCVVRPGQDRLQGDAEAGRRRRRARRRAQAAPGALLRRPARRAGPCCGCSTWPASGRCPTCRGSPRDRAAAGADRAAPAAGNDLSRSAAAASAGWSTASRAKPPRTASATTATSPARLVDASAAGIGLVAEAPLEVGARPAVLLELDDAGGETHEVAAQVEVRSCREADGRFLVGATIVEIDPASRLRLMEWCYVVCSHERLRGHRPARLRCPSPRRSSSPLDDYRAGPMPARPPRPALRRPKALRLNSNKRRHRRAIRGTEERPGATREGCAVLEAATMAVRSSVLMLIGIE